MSLFGNHELMAFTGKDGRYVHGMEYVFFESPQSRAMAFSPTGWLWQSINSQFLFTARLAGAAPSALDTLFIHAGLSTSWLLASNVSDDVTKLNDEIRTVMWDQKAADRLLSPKDSPLWTRDFESYSHSEDWCESELAPLLARFRVSRIVVGHSPLSHKRAINRCNGALIMTDVMLSRWMGAGGQPVAITMRLVHSEDGEPTLSSIEAHYYSPSKEEEETNVLWPLPVQGRSSPTVGQPKAARGSQWGPDAAAEYLEPNEAGEDAMGVAMAKSDAAGMELESLPEEVKSVPPPPSRAAGVMSRRHCEELARRSPLLDSVWRTRQLLNFLQQTVIRLPICKPDGGSHAPF